MRQLRQVFPVTTAVKPAALEPLMGQLTSGKRVDARVEVRLELEKSPAFNVAGLLEAGEGKLPGTLVIGAHYDLQLDVTFQESKRPR